MKILLVTDFFPTPDNFNGPSAINYHIMKSFMAEHDVMIITTNANKVPDKITKRVIDDFDGKVIIHRRSLFQRLLINGKTGKFFTPFYGGKLSYLTRYKLPCSELHRIKNFEPDIVLIYPDHMIGVMKQLRKYKPMVIGPDCLTVHYLRSLSDRYVYEFSLIKNVRRKLEKQYNLSKALVHHAEKILLVGLEDQYLFETITNSGKSYYLPHPHFGLANKNDYFENDKIEIVISGKYDGYTFSDINKFVKALNKRFYELQDFRITFIGKTWDSVIDKINKNINVRKIDWVDDYADEIVKYDIQIFPISVGSGTKGKVLDALSFGLICIGSKIAFENIAVRNGESCLIYDDISNIIDLLLQIKKNKSKYIEMAKKGKEQVRLYHNPKSISEVIISLSIRNNYNVPVNIYKAK